MNPWTYAAMGLAPPLAVSLWASGVGSLPQRLVALELATTLSIGMLAVLSPGGHPSSSAAGRLKLLHP